jgi:hypothetical protein
MFESRPAQPASARKRTVVINGKVDRSLPEDPHDVVKILRQRRAKRPAGTQARYVRLTAAETALAKTR